MWEPTQWVGQDGQALYAFLGGVEKNRGTVTSG